jgi:hypothetical protein
MPTNQAVRYHESADAAYVNQGWQSGIPIFEFQNFLSPFVAALIGELNTATGDPIAQMLDPGFLANPDPNVVEPSTQFQTEFATLQNYSLDLDPQLPYANYHWELGYHLLHAIADIHHQNGRYDEELVMLRYILDPSSTDDVPAPARFWKFLYFRNNPYGNGAPVLQTLSDPSLDQTPIINSYNAAMMTPFQPFAVARARTVCFQYFTVMKLLDCYVAKTDSLMANPTIETVNEATQWIIRAANLLGPRPQQIPSLGTTAAMSYNDLGPKSQRDALGDALVNLEGQFPFNLTTSSAQPSAGNGPVLGVGRTLYFCIPEDQTLLGYWDTVEDRLNKIRACENLAGQVQLMPLFDPPIDPGLLVAAVAAGLDIAAAIAGLSQPVSAVRTPTLIRKALEMAAEVRTLGNELQAALEKQDAQHLAFLRQQNDTNLQNLIISTRQLQWQQAVAAGEALLAQQQTAYERYTYYMHLFGQTVGPLQQIDPQTITIDQSNFATAYNQLVNQYGLVLTTAPYSTFTLPQSTSPSTQGGATNPGPLYLSSYESQELSDDSDATSAQVDAAHLNRTASLIAEIPNLIADTMPMGVGTSLDYGGKILADIVRFVAESRAADALRSQGDAVIAGKTAGYQRRADDWTFQLNLALRELQAIGAQLLTSIIAQQAAFQELSNAQQQAQDSQDVLTYMTNMFTNEKLYGWLQGQLLTQYQKYYQFAVDLARKAEATMKWELMRPEVDANTYIQPSYFNSTWDGLTAGDALIYDIRRLDTDYDNYNLRELELTQHVSLRQLDPAALLNLIITGSCTVSVPEWLYDLDCPGHYMRRIKTVAVTVPCVAGPYTNVACTATLQNSSVRTTPGLLGGQYLRSTSGADPRFIDYYGSPDSIVTSSGTNDSGMFETNLRDERFLPFEGAGAISTWTLALPYLRTFDYSTITDVILHIRHTARDGGAPQNTAATTAVETMFNSTQTGSPSGQALLLCLRYDFATEWYAFVNNTDGSGNFTATVSKQQFPYLVQNSKLIIDTLTLYAAGTGSDTADTTVQSYAVTSVDLTTTGAFNTGLNSSSGEATLTLSPDPNGILTPTLTKQVYLVLGYHFAYSP